MSNVIEMGEFRLKRKPQTYFPVAGECGHKYLELDDQGDIVRCTECKVQVSPYWALSRIAEDWGRMAAKFQAQKAELEKDKAANIHLVAARNAEQGWRKRDMVPACPHCDRGILPEDGFGLSLINRAMEMRRRESEKTA